MRKLKPVLMGVMQRARTGAKSADRAGQGRINSIESVYIHTTLELWLIPASCDVTRKCFDCFVCVESLKSKNRIKS